MCGAALQEHLRECKQPRLWQAYGCAVDRPPELLHLSTKDLVQLVGLLGKHLSVLARELAREGCHHAVRLLNVPVHLTVFGTCHRGILGLLCPLHERLKLSPLCVLLFRIGQLLRNVLKTRARLRKSALDLGCHFGEAARRIASRHLTLPAGDKEDTQFSTSDTAEARVQHT